MPSEAQDDLLITVALARLSYQFEEANEAVANRAWDLAVRYAERQGLRPAEAVEQFNW
jgi:hypothetical protein